MVFLLFVKTIDYMVFQIKLQRLLPSVSLSAYGIGVFREKLSDLATANQF